MRLHPTDFTVNVISTQQRNSVLISQTSKEDDLNFKKNLDILNLCLASNTRQLNKMKVMSAEEKRRTLKCTIVGDCMVGKTLICKTLTRQAVTEGYTATVCDLYTHNTFMLGEDYTINITDLSGQCDYQNIRIQNYKDTDIFIVCYSDTDKDSFLNIEKFWVPEIRKTNKKSPMILVSTINDSTLQDNNDELSSDEKSVLENCKIDRLTRCRCHVAEDVDHLLDDIALLHMKQKRRRRSSVLQTLHDLVTK